jgi:Na+-transporting NADH:ubiquinone oxidoreductase subunit C
MPSSFVLTSNVECVVMAKDTVTRTLIVAGLLSVVCSALVSTSAVVLRPRQAENKDLDRKKNILQAAGLFEEGRPVAELFAQFEIRVVDLATGEFRDDIDVVTFDQRKAAKSNDQGLAIPKKKDLAGIKRRSQFALVYVSLDEKGALQQLILPVHGKGLWSTLYGYLALDADLTTINGFAFYEHGETPGLGGEVDNPRWKKQWIGKEAFDAEGNASIEVLKGKVDPASADSKHEIDGLAGATITSRGVSALLKYWLGEEGFKPLLDRLRKEKGS